MTSNRAVDEWRSLFDDPILGHSALDRLANASYQIVIEGPSYRERLSPHRALLGAKGGDLPGNHKLILIKIATRPRWYIVLGGHWLNVHSVSQVKPFSPTEPVARVRAALRRRERPEPEAPYVLGDLATNYADRRVTL